MDQPRVDLFDGKCQDRAKAQSSGRFVLEDGTIFSFGLFFISFYNEIWSPDCNTARDSLARLDACRVFDIRHLHGVEAQRLVLV